MPKKEEKKNPVGRPKLLHPDEATLNIVKGLGQIQATSRECAAVLGVHVLTWYNFKKEHDPIIQNTYDIGAGEGRASLRRRQFAMAENNPTMAIWLGKQYLDQKDKHENITQVDVTVTDAREQLNDLIDRHAIEIEPQDTDKRLN